MKIGMKKVVDVDVTTVVVDVKVRDEGYYTFKDQDGEKVKSFEGYVPSIFPDTCGGDYLRFEINIETGQILNWPSKSAIENGLMEVFNEDN